MDEQDCVSKTQDDDVELLQGDDEEKQTQNLLNVPQQTTTVSDQHRLVIVSSKIRQTSALQAAKLDNVDLFIYQEDQETLSTLVKEMKARCLVNQPVSIAFLAHGHPGSMVICSGRGEKVLSIPSLREDTEIQHFLQQVETCIDRSNETARLDFLSCPLVLSPDWSEAVELIKPLVKDLLIGLTKDVMGPDILGNKCLLHDGTECEPGDYYFQSEKLRKWSGATPRSISYFEKIRMVGKGSYGTAVLYRKKDDDSLVILKEINMHDLTAQERLMATNEAKIMSRLNHPNIINCYDSFEEDGTIWIEMEYADGGTLTQYLAKLDRELEEKEILKMFYQMALALQCIHEHKILHRDLKTQNVFLTLEGDVKLGDFGISKQLGNTRSNANTVLGTPYYISPEICEGKDYNEKSDIWSLGCVLYEMANKQKTFESTNLPALVNKIVKGQFAPIRGNYSQEFKGLVRDCLQIEPQYRPNASDLVTRVQELLSQFDENDEVSLESALNPKRKERRRSILYFVDLGTMSAVVPIDLPAKIQIVSVDVGKNHVCVVSSESLVFSWGDNSKGQLGHGDLVSRDVPTQIEGVKGKKVVMGCCGDRFTVLLTDNGIVMSFGDGDYGCMGHGDWSSVSRPKLVEGLLAVDTGSISCGLHHVSAVCDDGSVYTWGCGDDGRLGLGDEQNRKVPHKVEFSDKVFIKKSKCGVDGTMFLTDTGTLYACGKNSNNKLGLNNRQGFLVQMKNLLTKVQVEGRNTPTAIKVLAKNRVSDMSLGPRHSAVLMESGQVYTFGDNRYGQLGHGNTKPMESLAPVKSITDKRITMINCGDCFTVAGTDEDTIYFWGTMPFLQDSSVDREETDDSLERKQSSGHPSSSLSSATSEHNLTASPRTSSARRPLSAVDCDQASSPRKKELLCETSAGNNNASESKPGSAGGDRPRSGYWRSDTGVNYLKECAARSTLNRYRIDGCLRVSKPDAMMPKLMFQWDVFCGPSDTDGDYPVFLRRISGCIGNMFVQIETTAPATRRKSKKKSLRKDIESTKHFLASPPSTAETNATYDVKKRLQSSENSSSSRRLTTDSSTTAEQSSSSEMDTMGDAPTWLRSELKDGIDKKPRKVLATRELQALSSVEDSVETLTDQDSDEVFLKPAKEFPRRAKKPAISQEKTYSKYRAKTKGKTTGADTKIVGGVAVATNGNDVTNLENDTTILPGQVFPDGPPQAPQPRRKRTKVKLDSQVFYQPARGGNKAPSSLRATSAEKPHSSSESGVEMTPLEQLGSEEYRQKRSSSSTKSLPVNASNRLATNPLKKGRVAPSTNKAWEKSPPPDCRQRIPRTASNGSIPTKRRITPKNEEKQSLLNIPPALRKHHSEKDIASMKSHRLSKPSDVYLNGSSTTTSQNSESDLSAQLKEARLREEGLVDEIQVLKSELLKQSSKLQENFHVVISLQEQVARLQEEQLKQQAKEKRSISNQNEGSLSSGRRASMKSTVCSVM